MKKIKINNSAKGIRKGTSTGILLSLGIHVALFLLAGMLVVFTVVKKQEQVFEHPKQVERPKMKLKKPKVKIKSMYSQKKYGYTYQIFILLHVQRMNCLVCRLLFFRLAL